MDLAVYGVLSFELRRDLQIVIQLGAWFARMQVCGPKSIDCEANITLRSLAEQAEQLQHCFVGHAARPTRLLHAYDRL